MDQAADPFVVSMSMLTQCADIAIGGVPAGHDVYLLDAAKSRFAEFQALLHLAAGRSPGFNSKLQPLTRAINDFVASVDKQVHVPIDEDVPEDALEAELLHRENAALHLDQARVAGAALLMHLSIALQEKPKSPQLSLVL